jgi:hypothetical protein
VSRTTECRYRSSCTETKRVWFSLHCHHAGAITSTTLHIPRGSSPTPRMRKASNPLPLQEVSDDGRHPPCSLPSHSPSPRLFSLSFSLFLPTPLSAPAPFSCLPWLMTPEHGGSSYLPSRTHATPRGRPRSHRTSARHVVALAHPHGRRRARVGYPVARRRCAAEMREGSANQSAGRGTERGMGLGVYVGAELS